MKELRNYQKQAVMECWQALKENDEPVLLMASVGAGKSLMLAEILFRLQKLNKRALCLVNNAELVRNNCAIFKEQGGNASIYCAALDEKNTDSPIIFGTPQSIINGVNKNERIAQIQFNVIIIDEAHTINYHADNSVFMCILRYYKQRYEKMRILGATGTNFRYKGTEICGDNCLFKRQVGNITTEKLIKEGYLIEPDFNIDPNLVIDFSKVKIKQNGKFDSKELDNVIKKNTRLSELICDQIVHIMESRNRYGVFIFATTRKHAEEIMGYLPKTQSALILGDTPHKERTRILNEAREGKIKYLVNIAIISVGVDVPVFDTIAYLRPTESLVLLIQTMGRVLRLSPATNKTEALVLDFAGNIERHSHWDNPILLKAVKALDKDKPLVIKCPVCLELNTETARRCVGLIHDKRCTYLFEFKECPNQKCKTQNDIASRHCRVCQKEIINPNDKLSLLNPNNDLQEMQVLSAVYAISDCKFGFRVNCMYVCKNKQGQLKRYYENYVPISDKAKHVFYGQFVKKHCDKPSFWYPYLTERSKMELMVKEANDPTHIMIQHDEVGYKIKKKIFSEKKLYELRYQNGRDNTGNSNENSAW